MISKFIRVLLIIATLAAIIYAFISRPEVQSMLPENLNPFAQGIHSSSVVAPEPQIVEMPEVEIDSLDVAQIDTLQIDTMTIE